MKISATDADPAKAVVVFFDEGGALADWLMLEAGEVVLRSESSEPLPKAGVTALVVPGEQVSIHWLDLAEGLTPAQATAAARLLLADATAEATASLHAAVGRREKGLTPVALVPVGQMAKWLETATGAGLDPNLVMPSTLLLPSPPSGFLRREREGLSDYRGLAAAFSLEPELAQTVFGVADAEAVDQAFLEAALPAILADPPINLLQGAFARRRHWRVDRAPVRRVASLILAFIALTLILQVVLILRYTFAADTLENEARRLGAAQTSVADRDFAAAASRLFDSLRSTPNVELTRVDYRPDGVLTATLQADSSAALSTLAQQLTSNGVEAEQGPPRNVGGRTTAEFTLRAR